MQKNKRPPPKKKGTFLFKKKITFFKKQISKTKLANRMEHVSMIECALLLLLCACTIYFIPVVICTMRSNINRIPFACARYCTIFANLLFVRFLIESATIILFRKWTVFESISLFYLTSLLIFKWKLLRLWEQQSYNVYPRSFVAFELQYGFFDSFELTFFLLSNVTYMLICLFAIVFLKSTQSETDDYFESLIFTFVQNLIPPFVCFSKLIYITKDDRRFFCHPVYVHASEKEAQCVICLLAFEKKEMLQQLRCKHLFHPNCINIWLQHSNLCPLCRRSIDDFF